MVSDKPSTWILLRGLSRESGHWGGFKDRFAASRPQDQVLTLDLPGTGSHLDQASPRTISQIFQLVRAEAIERVDRSHKIKLLAVSLGGMVAAEWARQSPDELAACVLINTSSKSISPFYQRLRWQIWREFFKILTIQAVRERERQVLELLCNNAQAREAALPLWAKIGQERPVSYLCFFNQIVAASRYSGLSSTQVPTLVLSGLGDRLVDPSCSTDIHNKFGWPIFRHPWAGHDLPWDDPQWVLDKIEEWHKAPGAK